jgi:ribosomal protein S18 acetylase RimI-like enzyme
MEIRNYSPDMIYNYCKFYNKARSDRPDYEEVTVEAIHAYFTPPYYDPKGHFLALIDDQIVADALGSRNLGYMVFPIDRINFTLNVLPDYRSQGIGRQLLDTAINYFLNKRMKVAVIDDVHAKCRGSIKFYEKVGFKEAARSYWMECDLSNAKWLTSHQASPRGYHVRSLATQDELEVFRGTVNDAFSDTPGFTPVDQEQFQQRYLNRPVFDLEGFIVAVDDTTNLIVGTAAALIEIDSTKKETFGHIKAVGVLKPHRGRGLARSLMVESMKWLASHEIPVAKLGTSNPHAFRLYHSLGFKVLHEYVRLEKAYA